MPPQNPTVSPVQPAPQPVVPPQPQPIAPAPMSAGPAPAMQLNPAYGHDKLAIASLILGIVSLPASILTLFTLPIPVTAIVLGMVSLKRKKSFAVAGIVLGIVGIILSVVLLVVGMKVEQNKKNQSGSSTSKGVTATDIKSNCYSFSLPDGFSKTDVNKNEDCVTIMIKSNQQDDLVVNSSDLASPVADADRDAYLKSLVSEFQVQVGSAFHATDSKYVEIDGVRAYQVTGTENHGAYKYAGFLAVLSPKDYISVTGVKLRAFIVAYDSATSQDRLDKLAQSWHWQ